MRNNTYTYRFFYTVGFYGLTVSSIVLSIAWIVTSNSRDKSAEMELYWRNQYIESRLLLNKCVRENDVLIDIFTAQDVGICAIYCDEVREFKEALIKKHYKPNEKENNN
jgi:hypothetical protein